MKLISGLEQKNGDAPGTSHHVRKYGRVQERMWGQVEGTWEPTWSSKKVKEKQNSGVFEEVSPKHLLLTKGKMRYGGET